MIRILPMKNLIKKIFHHEQSIIIFICALISISSFIYYYNFDYLNLAYGDAVSRLNISRKILDNITPGLGQLGSVWLPLTHILMIPFIWNDFMWHTGAAGWIVSGIAFIITCLYLYKIGKDIFVNRLSGIVMFLCAITNINFIYMQTTAMTEVFFIMTVVTATYYLMKWSRDLLVLDLMMLGIIVSASSLVRYEGLFIVILSCIYVFIFSFIKSRTWKTTEGNSVMFGTLALTGIVIWCIYCGIVFGNPLLWKDIYSGKASVISTENYEQLNLPSPDSYHSKLSLLDQIGRYGTTMMQMNGLLTSAVSIISFVYLIALIAYLIKKREISDKLYLVAALLPLAVYAFVVMTLTTNFPLIHPPIDWDHIVSPNLNYQHSEYNIRYGLNLLPFVVIMIGWIISKSKRSVLIIMPIIFIQFYLSINPSIFVLYSIPFKLHQDQSGRDKFGGSVGWLKKNYDGGLIIMSAYKHDPEMFFLGFNYKTFIHEGTQKYWLTSIKDPQRYATWIYMTRPPKDLKTPTDEPVTKYLGNNQNVEKYYNLVYDDEQTLIYKIKSKPELTIPTN
ncbi:MAG: glycosyltransferase family 39 protein [bacterium]|nr:glycosyltransferase family 39 protein [bacterium]